MAVKRPSPFSALPALVRMTTCFRCQTRTLHRLNAPAARVPNPTPFVPDVSTFLTLIGRGLSQHASKIPSWEGLFSLSSAQLREAGVEPARARRYLLWWRERFRNGIVGIGGDMTKVKDGVGELKIVEVPSTKPADQMATLTKDPGMRKIVINTPLTISTKAERDGTSGSMRANIAPPARVPANEAKPVVGVKIFQGGLIGGRGVQLVKGHQGVAILKVQEGLWEQRRGHKVDGGERRKAMTRAKRRAAERSER